MDSHCPFCQTLVVPGEQKVCPVCQVTHHKGCWIEYSGCTTPACSQGPGGLLEDLQGYKSGGEVPTKETQESIPGQLLETSPVLQPESQPQPQSITLPKSVPATKQDPDKPRRKLGVLISVGPDHPNFGHGTRLAAAAMQTGIEVYLYCLDDAVLGINDNQLQSMRCAGLRLFGCEFARRNRKLPPDENAIYGGLTMLSDLAGATDRFISFN